jgi:hypothetical protein|eukprot:2214938-Prymnesium_polylepis.1
MFGLELRRSLARLQLGERLRRGSSHFAVRVILGGLGEGLLVLRKHRCCGAPLSSSHAHP